MKPLPYQLQPLTVALRVRPMNHGEMRCGATTAAHAVDKNLVVLMDPNEDSDDILRANRSREKQFHFDVAFSEMASQRDVYQATVLDRDIIGRVTSGYNCTVFAYGATGAGKTYTMLGTEKEPGIMVLTLNNLFDKIEDTSNDMMYRVTMAYMEIYNEMIRDLLNPSSGFLDLFEDSSGEIVVGGLLEVETSGTFEVMKLLRRGNLRRTVEPTAANKTSSRSHAILKVTVEQRDRAMTVSQEVRTGVLFMVDLAGSERAAVTQNRGKRMVEGAHINRSLLALANCINALGTNHTHYVNYRDSKLTRLLKDALGGNCKTVMIAHISPASSSFEESRNTLAYAERGKKIKNKTRQNATDVSYHITQYHFIIKQLHQKIDDLQGQLDRQQSIGHASSASPAHSKGGGGGRASFHCGEEEHSGIHELCDQLKTTAKEEKEIRQSLFSVECQLLHNALEYQRHRACILDWQKKRDSVDTDGQGLLPSGSHDSHMTNEASTTDSGLHLPLIKPHPHHSISPDSGTDVGGPGNHDDALMASGNVAIASGNHSNMVMEPEEVSLAREEVATLVADKQRLEARHKRLERQLKEIKTKMADIKESLSSIPELLPVRKELIDLLHYSYELEVAGVEHSLASTLIGVQLRRQELSIEKLLLHSSELLEVIDMQRRLMNDHSVPSPSDLALRTRELIHRQESLTAQVAAEKQLPPIAGAGIQLPAIARFSAKLYSTMTGSKSNLFIDDTSSEPEESGPLAPPIVDLSDIHLPNLDQPSQASERRERERRTPPIDLPPLVRKDPSRKVSPPRSTLKKNHSSVSLPPIDTASLQSLVVAKSDISDREETSLHVVSKKSDTALIVEAAKRARENLIAGIPSPKKVLTKMTSFTTPRMSVSRNSSNRSKYIVPPSKTAIIDIEGGGGGKTGEGKRRRRHHSISSGKSRSHPHLMNSTHSKVATSRSKLPDKLASGSSASLKKPFLSDASLRRVRDGRTVVTIDELEKLTRRAGKSSSLHNTPLHQRQLHHQTSHARSPHHKQAGPSSTSLSKVMSPSRLAHQNSPSKSSIHKSSSRPSRPPAGSTTVVTKSGRRITVRRALPQPPTIRGRYSPLPRRQLVPSKVNAGNNLSNLASPYVTPVRSNKQGTTKSKRTREWIN